MNACPRSFAIFFVLVCACLARYAAAVELGLWHPYGEFVDRGDVQAFIHPTWPDRSRLDCNKSVDIKRTGTDITLTAQKVAGSSDSSDPCTSGITVQLGALAAATYVITAKLLSVDGNSFEARSTSVQVLPLVGRCNADPLISPELIVMHNRLSPQQLARRIAYDPIYALRLGIPALSGVLSIGSHNYADFDYPPLEDVTVKIDLLTQTGEFFSIERNFYLCFGTPPGDVIADVVEFYDAIADQYFYTADAAEMRTYDSGLAGAAWSRTGKSFRAVTAPGCPFLSLTPVYRFNGVPNVGPVSHFFTRSREECYAVDTSKAWTYESVAYWASAVNADGTCGYSTPVPLQVPLHRMLRITGETRHRYTIDRAIVDDMVAKGWIYEGPVMCVAAPGTN